MMTGSEKSSLEGKNLNATAMKAAGWTLGGFGFSRVLRLVNHLLLAWLLSPQIFGLMTLVRSFKQGVEMFSDIGIRPSIIRSSRGYEQAFLDTAWTIQVMRGITLWIVSCLLGPPFAWMLSKNDPDAWQLSYLIPISGFLAVLLGFQSTAWPLLNREMRIGKITVFEIKIQLVTLVAIAVWALIDPSVWAMIGGGLIGGAYQMVESHRLMPGHRVWFRWDKGCAEELFKFGKWIFLSTLLTFLSVHSDKLLLGGMVSLEDLGIYGISFVFAHVALDVAMRLGNTVLYPIYSHFKDDSQRLMAVAIKARRAVLWAGGCVCVCFAICAPMFFEALWDSRYHSAGRIAQWLSLFIWGRILLSSMDRIPLALGNSRVVFLSNVVQVMGILPASLGYWLGGLPLFITGLSLGPACAHLFLVYYLPEKRWAMLLQSIRFTGAWLVVGFLSAGVAQWGRTFGGLWVWIATQATACVFVLLVTFWFTKDLLPEKIRRRLGSFLKMNVTALT